LVSLDLLGELKFNCDHLQSQTTAGGGRRNGQLIPQKSKNNPNDLNVFPHDRTHGSHASTIQKLTSKILQFSKLKF
jgi:hypothetical protein